MKDGRERRGRFLRNIPLGVLQHKSSQVSHHVGGGIGLRAVTITHPIVVYWPCQVLGQFQAHYCTGNKAVRIVIASHQDEWRFLLGRVDS